MNKAERKASVEKRISAFSSNEYSAKDFFNELMKLQSEFAEITFGEEKPRAKIQEIRKHYEQMNIERGHIADAEFDRFFHSSFDFQNEIKGMLSGKKGEKFTANALNKLNANHEIIRNVELESEGVKTELDYVVVTGKAIFILEVKNTSRDIIIDNDGNYIRVGKHMHLEYNISEKMDLREKMLRELLNNAGIYNVSIQSFLVFTNNRITVSNYCNNISTTFLNQLPYLIDNYNGWTLYSTDRIAEIKESVEKAIFEHMYSVNDDIYRVKEDFVNLVIALGTEDETENKKQGFFSVIWSWFAPKAHTAA